MKLLIVPLILLYFNNLTSEIQKLKNGSYSNNFTNGKVINHANILASYAIVFLP